jgi:hypothetical protein
MKKLTLATAVLSSFLWAPSVGIASETSRAIILAQMPSIEIGPDGVRVGQDRDDDHMREEDRDRDRMRRRNRERDEDRD